MLPDVVTNVPRSRGPAVKPPRTVKPPTPDVNYTSRSYQVEG
jgi:hypothetical protein